MTTETIEGTSVDVTREPTTLDEPVRAVVVAQPGQAIVSEGPAGPEDMLIRATAIATALSRMVEQQKLYTKIGDKKYPSVEAWMTIARMDNVVAREVRDGVVQLEDGSFEANVELVRLSDGLVIGHGSARCGGTDDKDKWGKADWSKRPAHQRRSMAVTRATSRAFRQHYSWIMALAGYEPTPADEMTSDEPPRDVTPEPPTHADGLIGTVEKGSSAPVDMEMRITKEDGPLYGFKLKEGRKGYQVVATGDLADVLAMVPDLVGQRAEVWGRIEMVPWRKGDRDMPPFPRIHLERIKTDDWVLPADVGVAQTVERSAEDGQAAGSTPAPDTIPVAPGQEALPL